MIHPFRFENYNIVVDTYSGAVHVMDGLAFRAVNMMNHSAFERTNPDHWSQLTTDLEKEFEGRYSSEEVRDALLHINQLIDNDQIFSADSYEGLSLNLKDRVSNVKALCLNVAHTCNLDCDYCFASQGKYRGERALMSAEVARKAVDFLIRESGHHRQLDIDFFGGEPLMNLNVVKETVRYARSLEKDHNKHFRFTFTTNGILLDDENIAYLNEEMDNVVLSLDGRKEVHDRFRHSINGSGSYERIVPKFQKFVQERGDKEYYIRGTYTKINRDFFEDILHMTELGFHRLSMEPVIGDEREPYMLGPADVDFLSGQYELLAKEMMRRNEFAYRTVKEAGDPDQLANEDRPFVFYHFMLDLDGGPCIHKRISGCGAGTEYLAVTPSGDLYPCHQFVGEESFTVGNVFEGIRNRDLGREFKECNVYAQPECADCWAKLYCSGGCSANALHATGSIAGTVPFSCDLFRKRMECALAVKVHEALLSSEEE